MQKTFYILTIGLIVLAASSIANAQNITAIGGGLLVAPTKLEFEGKTRSAELVLRNRGLDDATYRISVVNREKNEETGRMEDVELSGYENGYADQMIRFSPRQVTLKAGEVQTVRVALRKPEDLPAGEYKTRLAFQAIPPAVDIEEQEEETNEVKLELKAIYGISIPISVIHQ